MSLTTNRTGNGYRSKDPSASARAASICIVGSETGVARLALHPLERADFAVRMLAPGMDRIRQIQQFHPALTLIEADPERRGLELCRAIRKIPSLAQMPVILLAKNSSEEERVTGLESGADDYITQCSSSRELVARVRAILRRFTWRQTLRPGTLNSSSRLPHSIAGTPASPIKTGDLEIDTCAMKIRVCGNEVAVTALEFRLTYYLVHNQLRVFSRDQLLDAVWGTQHLETRSVDGCVRRLRRKIEPDPENPRYLRTVRGVGYSFNVGEMLGHPNARINVGNPTQEDAGCREATLSAKGAAQ